MVLYKVDNLRELVNLSASGFGKTPPLVAVHWTQVSVLVGPLVPDAHPVVFEVFDVRISAYEPQKFIYDGLEVDLFGGQKRKALREVEAHLVSEDAFGPHACAVGLDCAVIKNILKEIKVLFHGDGFNLCKCRK